MNNRRVITYGIMGILAAAGLSNLLLLLRDVGFFPAGKRAGGLSARLETLDGELRRAAPAEPEPVRADNAPPVSDDEYVLATQLVPGAAELDGVIERVKAAARAAGVEVTETLHAGTPFARANGVEEWRVRFRIRGDFDRMAAFVNATERFDAPDAPEPRRVEWAELAMASDGDRGEAEAVLRIYAYADDAGEPVAGAAESLADLLDRRQYEYAAGGRDPLFPRPAPPREPAVAEEEPAQPTQETAMPLREAEPTAPTRAPAPTSPGQEEREANAAPEMIAETETKAEPEIETKAEAKTETIPDDEPPTKASSPEPEPLPETTEIKEAEETEAAKEVKKADAADDVSSTPAPSASPDFSGLRVDGVSLGGGGAAVINGRIYRIGDAVAGRDEVRVEAIDGGGVTLRIGEQTRRLSVRLLGTR